MFPCDPLQPEQILEILSEVNVIDIVAKTLLNVYEGTYSLSSTLKIQNGVLATYVPSREIGNALPPIILNIQPNLDQEGMTNAIDQCLQTHEQHHQLPVILFISSNKPTEAFLAPFKPVPSKPHLYFLPNAAWCCKCFFLPSNFDNGLIHQDELSSIPSLLLESNHSDK
ncbi:hypothetical protein RO3G_03391 [Lichtheimia corymbifera JMRC:FSU:9682]|uniref:Uncharacterized protein n=1 Tax=Lichtheimia corymbifera JMRC:FSU:9682 TaxID=1263082 RepID=A0A068SH74_9FUNG|nr:hypothetical protein RO3G_03391 [Lichtheimia corymbifera JMRC:FSU:9682]